MALFPGALIPWITLQFFDADGNPLAGGKLYSYVTGTTTFQDTYSDVDLTDGTQNPNPIVFDVGGRSPNTIFLMPTGYDFVVTDANDVEIFTIENIEDVGQVFASQFGNVLSEGGSDVVSGYQVLVTDRLVTVDSTGGADPCVINLLPAAEATQMLTIKNLGTEPLAVTPNGSDTIDTVAAVFTVPAAASPTFPSIILVSDAVSSWFILASHGL